MRKTCRGETGNMGQRVIWDNAEKQLQAETRVCKAALWLVNLELQQFTKLEVIETVWRMQDYRFIFYALLFQKKLKCPISPVLPLYYIHTNVSQIRNITVYVLKAGQ